MRNFSYLKNGDSLVLRREACIGCGMCVNVCPHAVFSLSNGKVDIVFRSYCMECGACMKNCPVDAISVSAGVGCAAAIITGKLRGTAPECGCKGDGCCG